MRGGGYADVLPVLQVPDNKADAVPCERLQIFFGVIYPFIYRFWLTSVWLHTMIIFPNKRPSNGGVEALKQGGGFFKETKRF